jgi:signal transduction histidine kinase/CheY-like chemotaxis protein/HPt (histidine-containing phosphotransfer) domain-containing protein
MVYIGGLHMKQFYIQLKNAFFGQELDFRVKIFNLLAIASALNSIVMAILSVVNGAGLANTLLNTSLFLLAALLLYYTAKSKRYELCYMITIIVVFILLFPLLFFSSGGYHSGMPSFFIFAVVFTVYMVSGRKMLVMTLLESAVYVGICLWAYNHPESVHTFDTEAAILSDIITGFFAVSLILGVTMYIQFRMYRKQQELLEQAREQADAASRAKGAFLANMSHEIRTPINMMLGMNEMIMRESTAKHITEYAKNIQIAGEMLLDIISNILDMSKIESGKLELYEKPYRTASLLSEMAQMGGKQVEKKKLTFLKEVDESIPSVLEGDETRIKQIITNFIGNAVKYTAAGSVTFSAKQKPSSEPDSILLCLSVADTGIGIKEENLGLLFEAFGRVDLPAHRNIEGTGLGLAIAKELAESMGGRIFVESVWGKGSTFGVEIPQKIKNTAPIGAGYIESEAKAQRQEESFLAPKGKILAVDDNAENLEVVKSLLRRTMLQIATAGSGSEALQKVQENQYHVILIDYMMPDMDGVETLRRIREQNLIADTAVIALTANAVAGTKEMFLREGFSGCLTKPIMWQELEAVLLSCLPVEIVTKSVPVPTEQLIADEVKHALEKDLLQHDISLSEGLHFLNGDILQYKKRAMFFTEGFAETKNRAEKLLADKDFESLAFIIHSLKSNAHALGAMDLYNTAARMEKRCRDSAYIESAMPLLLLEWNRTNDGLLRFVSTLDNLLPDLPHEYSGQALDDCKSRALAAIAAYRWKEAKKELSVLLSSAQDNSVKERLEKVLIAVENMKFEQAEALFEEYLKTKGRDGHV